MAREFLQMVHEGDRAALSHALQTLIGVIAQSFKDDGSKVTQAETKRRFKICENLIRELRTDHGWAFSRIYDALPTALRAELDGIPWKPEAQHAIWMPRQ